MSAPAPALATAPRRTVTVRLADAALTVACLSLVFGFLLVFFPVSFARIIRDSWLHGNLTVAMMVITLSIDACLYVRIAYRLSAKPTVLAAACLEGPCRLSSWRDSAFVFKVPSTTHFRETCRICKLASARKYSPIPTWDWSPAFFCLSWLSGFCNNSKQQGRIAKLNPLRGPQLQ